MYVDVYKVKNMFDKIYSIAIFCVVLYKIPSLYL